jgi:hypothetical protein
MSSPNWSATEPMALSLNAPMPPFVPSPTRQIPSAAERYYAQPRTGSSPASAIQSAYHTSIAVRPEALVTAEPECGQLDAEMPDKGTHRDGVAPKRSRKRKRQRSVSISPSRQSPRLIKQKTAALERRLQECLAGEMPATSDAAGEDLRRDIVTSLPSPLPALSEDPARYSSDRHDCRFHLAANIEDRLAVRAAMTPTLFRLRKRGWDVEIVWRTDASYMEALQKCLHEYHQFEAAKCPDFSPFSLPAVLMLLPWQGKISDFRNSPNWPEGW